MSKNVKVQLSSTHFCKRPRNIQSVWSHQPHYDKTGLVSQIHSWSSCGTPGERWCMYLSWKWSYHFSIENIKLCLVCYLLKTRTNSMEAEQHQDFTVRCKTHIKAIFRVELHFPNPKSVYPPLHPRFPGLSRLLDKNYSFVNGLPPCSHPRIRYSIKTWGILLWLLVSCFLWKIHPPSLPPWTLIHTQIHSSTPPFLTVSYTQPWWLQKGAVLNINILPLGFS